MHAWPTTKTRIPQSINPVEFGHHARNLWLTLREKLTTDDDQWENYAYCSSQPVEVTSQQSGGGRRHNGMVAKFFLLARREKPLSHNRIKNASKSRSHRNLQKTTLYRFSASGSASSRECRVNSSFLCKCCHLVDTIKSLWKMGFLSFFT